MPGYHLYGHRSSGHSHKVALTLTLAGLPFGYTDVDPAQPRETRPTDWQQVSPWGEIPVLLDDGRPFVQSNAILLHLAGNHPELLAGHEAAAREWLFWEANRIGFSLPNMRWRRATGAGGGEVEDWLRTRLDTDLAELDRRLSGRAYLLSDRWSIADTACAAYLLLEDCAPFSRGYLAIEAWLDRLRASPGWAMASALMPA
jgi:glutathione S-transferase